MFKFIPLTQGKSEYCYFLDDENLEVLIVQIIMVYGKDGIISKAELIGTKLIVLV